VVGRKDRTGEHDIAEGWNIKEEKVKCRGSISAGTAVAEAAEATAAAAVAAAAAAAAVAAVAAVGRRGAARGWRTVDRRAGEREAAEAKARRVSVSREQSTL
jgi:hypothetical protein